MTKTANANGYCELRWVVLEYRVARAVRAGKRSKAALNPANQKGLLFMKGRYIPSSPQPGDAKSNQNPHNDFNDE